MGKKIVSPSDKVVLIDLDKTIIDPSYKITDPNIVNVIGNAQRAGWVVGLSSDTPLEALEVWAKRLGINGPIIAEKGGVIKDGSGIDFNPETAKCFEELKKDVLAYFSKQERTVLVEGNPVEEILKNRSYDPKIIQQIAYVNNLRRVSLSYHLRGLNLAGEQTVDKNLADLAFSIFGPRVEVIPSVTIDQNPDVTIIATKANNKRAGTQQLMHQHGWTQVAMIGDSMGDFVGPDLVMQYGVSNSSLEYRQKCVYVSDKPIASGVVDILSQLLDTVG